jgi:hypothetical protein
MSNFRDMAEHGLRYFKAWRQAVEGPEQFLAQAFDPSEAQLLDGLELYLVMMSVSLLFTAPLALWQRGNLQDRSKGVANTVLGLLFTGLVAMTWHIAFWLFGGASGFTGTYLAYIYAAAPLVPLLAFSSVLVFAGLPPYLRRFALSPATSRQAVMLAQDDPRTQRGLVALGGLLSFGLMVWSAIALLRALSFVHNLSGWRLVGAIVLSMLLAVPVGAVLRAVSAVLRPEGGELSALSED